MNWKQENRLKIDPQSIFSLFDFTQLKTFEVFLNSSVVDVCCSLLVFVILLYYKIVLFFLQMSKSKKAQNQRVGAMKKSAWALISSGLILADVISILWFFPILAPTCFVVLPIRHYWLVWSESQSGATPGPFIWFCFVWFCLNTVRSLPTDAFLHAASPFFLHRFTLCWNLRECCVYIVRQHRILLKH